MTTKGTKLVLLWTGASVISAPILYAVVPGIPSLLFGSGPFRERLVWFAYGSIYLGYFGVLFATLAALPCAGVFLAWATLSRRFGAIERSRVHVAAVTGLLAVPTAAVIVIAVTEFAGRIDWAGALEVFPCLLVIIWGALLWPRLICRCLAPGVFTAV